MAAKISPSESWENTVIALDNYKYLYYNHGSNVEVDKLTEKFQDTLMILRTIKTIMFLIMMNLIMMNLQSFNHFEIQIR